MKAEQPVSRLPSCDDEYDPSLIPVETALEKIAAAVDPIAHTEVVALREGLDRVLGADIRSPENVPNHTNSAMDGYAVRVADLENETLKVIGTSWAGKAFDGAISANQAVRIMTGAVIPEGADSIVIQEHVEREGDLIRVAPGQRQGQHVRKAGEDLAAGDVALTAGRRLLASDLGLSHRSVSARFR